MCVFRELYHVPLHMSGAGCMIPRMRRIITVMLVVGLSGLPARTFADDPLLIAIDDLTTEGRCTEALLLLEHVNGTRASIQGRRALCESRMGLHGDAAAHVAEALRNPDDPWVSSHREALLSALVPATETPEPVTAAPEVRDTPLTTNPYRHPVEPSLAANPYLHASVETDAPEIRVPTAYEEADATHAAAIDAAELEDIAAVPNPYGRPGLDRDTAIAGNPYYYVR